MSDYCVKESRVYATGHSNGGGFVGTLACSPDHGGQFAAFAPISGAFYTDVKGNQDCHPARSPLPMFEVHGTGDKTIPYAPTKDGSGGPLPSVADWEKDLGNGVHDVRYNPDELSLSYNGGKDCLVLLILILACLPATRAPAAAAAAAAVDPRPATIQAIYIAPPDPFPEVEDFVASTTAEYRLDLARYALPMRQALEAYRADKPSVRAIFMGTRRTDPHSESLAGFAPTDASWPQYMRVNPILDWRYADIWAFILRLDIPFCSLYQQGYSSLGGVGNTRPNPALAVDAEGTRFKPAYELLRDDEERLGRDV
ncbi:hypothetical protein UVI_02022980 [Ustilaginoidea virens]|uniref:FAD synthase n=1 Tax=Ustilaginoidea virens TaxID=1159556 RepID=A0A1B5L411_USTVR|nr:hypothetical protein UVI_02022980 [Ustilaginoidea virens]